MWYHIWHCETRVNPPRDSWNRSTDTRLPDSLIDMLSLTYLNIWISLSIGSIQLSTNYTLSIRYNYLSTFIFKLRIISNIIYKILTLIDKLGIICKGYNNPYKQGHTSKHTCAHFSLNRSLSSLHLRIYMFYLLTHILSWVSEFFVFQVPPSVLLTKVSLKSDVRSPWAHFDRIHPDVR